MSLLLLCILIDERETKGGRVRPRAYLQITSLAISARGLRRANFFWLSGITLDILRDANALFDLDRSSNSGATPLLAGASPALSSSTLSARKEGWPTTAITPVHCCWAIKLYEPLFIAGDLRYDLSCRACR